MNFPVIRVVRLPPLPIFVRLCIEEALFYKSLDNWFVYNEGSSGEKPVVVLGISGKPEKMCNLDQIAADGINMIRRFSGGGTVVVDSDTIFTFFAMNKDSLPNVSPFPANIMEWSKVIFAPAFDRLTIEDSEDFSLRENDYVFGEKKFGGNAQSISRTRWLHHTSFLWDFKAASMDYLRLPEKRPSYRGEREHSSFLTPLKQHISHKRDIYESILHEMRSHFDVRETDFRDVTRIIEGLGGMKQWMEGCRTVLVGPDGKPLDKSYSYNLFDNSS